MTGVRKALFISLLDRYLVLVLALASSMILARLLTPEQIGVYSVSLAVIGIAQVLRDFGIGNYLIQEKDLTEAQLRTAFGISLLLGSVMFLPLFLAAPWLADFYGDPRMVSTLRICSLNFIVLPFCSISLALLRREMQFGRLLYVSLAAAVVNFTVTLGLALSGHGPDSMAWGAVASNAATGLGAHVARGRPAFLWPSLTEWRRVTRFGGQSAVTSVVTSVSMDINDLALGKILGLAPVALFSRAQGLVNLFNRELLGAVRNVLFPAFAKSHREDQAIEPQHVHTVTLVTALGWPFFGFLALFPLETMRLMYGPQWDGAAALLPVLAAGGALYCGASFITSALMAVGRMDLVTTLELTFQPLRALAIVLTAWTTQSLVASAWAYTAAMALQVVMAFAFKQRALPTNWASMGKGVGRSALVSLLALIPALILSLQHGWPRGEPVHPVIFLAAILATILCWLIAVRICRHALVQEPVFCKTIGRLPGMRLPA
jgi:O-antigen/teichoic acid export membrane protein